MWCSHWKPVAVLRLQPIWSAEMAYAFYLPVRTLLWCMVFSRWSIHCLWLFTWLCCFAGGTRTLPSPWGWNRRCRGRSRFCLSILLLLVELCPFYVFIVNSLRRFVPVLWQFAVSHAGCLQKWALTSPEKCSTMYDTGAQSDYSLLISNH